MGLVTGVLLGLFLSWRTRSTFLALSARFPTDELEPTGAMDPQSLVINGMVLPGCFFLQRREEGLWVGPSALLSALGAAPVLIPWSACSIERQNRAWCTLRIGNVWLSGPLDRLQPAQLADSV